MDYQSMLGEAGKAVDRALIEWRRKGVQGSDSDRKQFEKEQYHGARGMMRLAVESKAFLSPEIPRERILESLEDRFLSVARHQAEQSGFDEADTEFYVGITRDAYRSLAEEYLIDHVV